jgi:hypothetical protein
MQFNWLRSIPSSLHTPVVHGSIAALFAVFFLIVQALFDPNFGKDWAIASFLTGSMATAFSWLGVSLWRKQRRFRLWRSHGNCVQCGYDLTANVSSICPECGTDKIIETLL